MPINSFSLVFDGDPVPRLSSEVFEMAIKRDAAWHDAANQLLANHPDTTPSIINDWNISPWHHFDGMPQIVKEIIQETSFIHCNFPLGGLWGQEILQTMQEKNDLDEQLHCHKWYDGIEDVILDTSPPLPPWNELRLEQVLPEEFEHRD